MELYTRTKSNQNGKNFVCQPCQSDGDNVEAEEFCETCNEWLCSSCLNVHRKLSMSKTHVTKSKDEMPSVHVKTDPCLELCEVHKTEIVKYFCEGHNSVGCGNCMVLKNRACTIELVNDISDKYAKSVETTTKIEEQEIGALKFEIKKSLKAADEVKDKVIKEIKTFCREMGTCLKKSEAALIDEVEKMNTEDVSQQRQLFNELGTMEIELKKFRKKQDRCSDKINQLFVTAKLENTELLSYKQRTEKIASESKIRVYKFDPCTDLNTLKVKKTHIGKLETTHIQKCYVKKDIAQYVEKINVKAINEFDCWITGLAMLSPDEILLADCFNRSVKVLNVKSKTITSILKLSCYPWDVTVINSETVATTLPMQGKIVFVSINNGLSETKCLKVRDRCSGIDHRNGVIAVSYTDSPLAVQILNMKGNILHEVVKDTSIYKLPYYIAFKDDNNIFVSDYYNNAVYELTIDGHLNASMKGELRFPKGLAVTSNGKVVCCPGNSDMMIMIKPGERNMKKLIVQDSHPWTVVLSEKTNDIYMYISEDYYEQEDRNFIKVYELM